MELRYQVLQVIYTIVKNENNPVTYPISLREIILRYAAGWESVEQHLLDLQEEQLITIEQLGKPVVRISEKGMLHAVSIIKL